MSEYDLLALFLSIIAIFLTIIHFIVDYFSRKRTQAPTIEISVDNLPPYKNSNAKTEIIVKNVGSSIAYDPHLVVEYSYAGSQTLINIDDNSINLNEKIEKFERLIDPPIGQHEIKFVVHIKMSSWSNSYSSFTKTVEIFVK